MIKCCSQNCVEQGTVTGIQSLTHSRCDQNRSKETEHIQGEYLKALSVLADSTAFFSTQLPLPD